LIYFFYALDTVVKASSPTESTKSGKKKKKKGTKKKKAAGAVSRQVDKKVNLNQNGIFIGRRSFYPTLPGLEDFLTLEYNQADFSEANNEKNSSNNQITGRRKDASPECKGLIRRFTYNVSPQIFLPLVMENL
jgi:hypothetical protein